jgi:hypothetical protein
MFGIITSIGLGLYFRDINDRKQLEINLLKSEEQRRLALDLNATGFIMNSVSPCGWWGLSLISAIANAAKSMGFS